MDIDYRVVEIAQKEGTPLYIFDVVTLKKRIDQIKNILGDKIKLCYSIKANPFLIPVIANIVDKLEVCSPGELNICENIGTRKIDMARIIYSGVNKTYENISAAFKVQVGEYTAESIQQVELINKVASENNLIVPVYLRLNIGSQFGMSEDDIMYVIKRKNVFNHINIVGLHYFVGTQRKNDSYEKQKNELNYLHNLYDKIDEKFEYKLKKLEYGPGFPVPLYNTDDFSDTLYPLKSLEKVFKDVSSWTELTVEMGRFIVSECGCYITKLMDKKTNDGVNYAIFDGGINRVNYYGQIMGMKTPIIFHYDKNLNLVDDEKVENWKICGSLCTINDDLVRSYKTSNMNIGDYFVFCNIGAYSVTEGIYLFLSRTLPKIVIYEGDGKYCVVRDFIETSILNTPTYSN